jgi:hypothetical protein
VVRQRSAKPLFIGSIPIAASNYFAIYDPALWELGLILARLHLVWIRIVCGKLESRLRYSSTFGWSTFPVPSLTEKNRTDLSRT